MFILQIFNGKSPSCSEWNSLSLYDIFHDIKGLKLLTRLRYGLSHLGDHKFGTNFWDCVSQCVLAVRIVKQQLNSNCPNHHYARKTLFHKVNQVIGTISRQSDSIITKILLFGDNKLDFETNKILLMFTIEFHSLTERFICPLFE